MPRFHARAWFPAVLLLALHAPGARAGEGAPTGDASAEIQALIARMGESACRFQRNGRWHDAAEAQAHLQRKYDWARRRGMSGDAEAFIERAASRSSLTGRPYRVACAGQPERDAGEWFRAQLRDLRADHQSATQPR
ncbi:DUF5329 domain-containing protein [Pseudoxanthomonas suwonensis]|uniref:DUF5329 domain-containing protein n=1 Tax=Pseudoxanthomonas suwonensis TaxID=314722 RepID=UPI0006879015|nr:DUF5329 domain-containing protein [Pseudoxanthomonas suwonensis]